jgi:hypothetical protein
MNTRARAGPAILALDLELCPDFGGSQGRPGIALRPVPVRRLVGGTQPAMLGTLADDRGRDDEFMDHFLFVYFSDEAFLPQHWTESEVSEEGEQAW